MQCFEKVTENSCGIVNERGIASDGSNAIVGFYIVSRNEKKNETWALKDVLTSNLG